MKLTINELATFNGQDGKKAYIAVNGIVYDVTNVDAWSRGKHSIGTVGTDISEHINKAPHGQRVLDHLTAVGELVK